MKKIIFSIISIIILIIIDIINYYKIYLLHNTIKLSGFSYGMDGLKELIILFFTNILIILFLKVIIDNFKKHNSKNLINIIEDILYIFILFLLFLPLFIIIYF